VSCPNAFALRFSPDAATDTAAATTIMQIAFLMQVSLVSG
jgi:hypothetical protein